MTLSIALSADLILSAVVFWGGPLLQLYDFLRANTYSVAIKSMRSATAADIERMHGDCAICWCEMTVAPGSSSEPDLGGQSHRQSDADPVDAHDEETAADNIAAAAGGPSSSSSHNKGQAASTSDADTDVSDASSELTGDNEQQESDVEATAADAAEPILVPGGSTDGYTLACGHAYHHQCLNQVSSETRHST